MSVRSRKRRDREVQTSRVGSALPNRFGWLYPLVIGAIVSGTTVFITTHKAITKQNAGLNRELAPQADGRAYPALGELAEMSDDELHDQDIALVNLRCAEGLPGAEKLNIKKCLQTLDDGPSECVLKRPATCTA